MVDFIAVALAGFSSGFIAGLTLSIILLCQQAFRRAVSSSS